MPDVATQPIEIFRAGKHTAVDGTVVEVSHADLAAIAASYDPTLGEAPHVVGHPQINAPAYGWVKGLEARDGILFAASDQLDPAFADLVKSGRFKKRSSSFFLPDSPGNPKPGSMYLRHVGWLGAAAPAVTGLRDVQFAADQAGVVEFAIGDRYWAFRSIATVFRRLRDRMVEQDGAEQVNELLPDYLIDDIAEAGRAPESDSLSPAFAAPAASPTEIDMPDKTQQQTADFAARETALTNRMTEIDARETRLRETEAKARRAGVVEFCAGLVKDGKLLPRQQAPMVELLFSIESAEQPTTLNFAAADGTQQAVVAGEALRTFLGELPKQVDFAERGAGEHPADAVEFAAPQGTTVDRTRTETFAKARAYQASHPNATWADAVRAAGG